MKINEIYRDIILTNTHGESAVSRKIEAQKELIIQEEKQDKSGTQVDLSQTSVEFSKVTASMNSQPPERAAKIEALKKQVQEDAYHVDAAKIAAKMIKNAFEDTV